MSFNSNASQSNLDVLGIGNAIVDVLIRVEDSFLDTNSLTKGSMKLIEEEEAEKLYSQVGPGIECSGGSAANTLTGVAQLGGKAGFIGRIRNDQLGKLFAHDIKSVGALFKTPAAQDGPSTARCLIFVTPDAQRTMCTFLGTSVLIEPQDLDISLIKEAKVIYLEGYLWDSSSAKSTFIAAAKAAKSNGKKVALSLSDPFCVDRHRESFIELIKNHIDILFANEDEIISLYQSKNFDKALSEIKGCCEIAALTRGGNGSVVISGTETWRINPFKSGPLLDTTGAGDLYAGGFLYGLTHGMDLHSCGNLGSICAGYIVTQMGPRSQISLKDLARRYNY